MATITIEAVSGGTVVATHDVENWTGTSTNLDIPTIFPTLPDGTYTFRARTAATTSFTVAGPAISGVPTISGTTTVGETLTATAASVTGAPTPTRTWQWERDGTAISGATSSTYTLVEADDGAVITVVQTETNWAGVDTAESAGTDAIAAVPTGGAISQSDPTVTGTVEVSGDDLIVTITAPAEYVGTHTVTGGVTAIQSAPVEVVAPTVSDDAGDPHPTFTAVPGLWIGENGAITTVREWLVEDVVVSTGATYLRQAGEEAKRIDYRERAQDSLAAEALGTLIEAQTLPFPNYISLPSSTIVVPSGHAATTDKMTFAGRLRFDDWGSFSSGIATGDASTYSWRIANISGTLRFRVFDSVYTSLADNINSSIATPANNTWASYVFAVDLSGGLPGGNNLAIWVNGSTYSASFATGTGVMNNNSLRNPQSTSAGTGADVEEFLIFDTTRAVDPATLGPLLFDTSNGYVARDIAASPPSGPWEFFLGGPAFKWVDGANDGTAASLSLDGNASETTP